MPRETLFFALPLDSDRNRSRFYKNSVKVVNRKCSTLALTIERRAAPSPDEFPKRRIREDGFSGLIFDRSEGCQSFRSTKTILAAFPWVSVDLA